MRVNNMNKLLKILAVAGAFSAIVGCSEKDTLGKARENLQSAIDTVYECSIDAGYHNPEVLTICASQIEEFKKVNLHFKNNYTNEHMIDKQLFEEKINKQKRETSTCYTSAWANKTDKSICDEEYRKVIDQRFETEYVLRFQFEQ